MDGFVPEGTKDMVNNNTSFADTSAGKAVLAEEMRQALDAQKRLLDQRLENMERQRDQAQETMDRKMRRLQREMEEREANLKKLEKESTKSEKQNAELKKKLRKLEKQQDAWKAGRSSDKGKGSSGTSRSKRSGECLTTNLTNIDMRSRWQLERVEVLGRQYPMFLHPLWNDLEGIRGERNQ